MDKEFKQKLKKKNQDDLINFSLIIIIGQYHILNFVECRKLIENK